MTDDLTWTKAKNALLVGIAGLFASVLGYVAISIAADVAQTRKDLMEIKVNLATFQANATAVEARVTRLESWEVRHDDADKLRFRSVGVR